MNKVKFRFDGRWYRGERECFSVLCKLAPRDRSAASDLLARFIRAGRVVEV